ncbi:hypothetical protein HJC23_001124 [Cyclotella cryptica]|uniref:P-loop containing nucleoside triphosphate hydrolase protein n=1 Tax=Cyclotella cryptica TaxID=29204 RepID=A0ABD3QJS9_9STRA
MQCTAVLSFPSRPGAGKSTICQEVTRLLTAKDSMDAPTTTAPDYLYLDLDVCVPQWMRVSTTQITRQLTGSSLCIERDNFARGIYPSLQQRSNFISDACKHVNSQIQSASTRSNPQLVVIISFSFVNIDMRISFRERYPYSHWILVDTTQHVAEERIAAREGHFYKGAQTNENAHSKQGGNLENNTTSQMDDKTDIDEGENSEWEFQPVAFDHAVLDGCDTINYNATRIAELIHSCQNKAQRAWL